MQARTVSNRLIHFLLSQFEADPALKKKCIDDSKSKIEADLVNRVFDEFPLLVSQKESEDLRQEFARLMSHSTHIKINQFEMKIIEIACAELLDGNGQLKQQLVKLLGWQDYSSKLDNHALVCAFVGAVNAKILTNYAEKTDGNHEAFPWVTDFISKNYSTWVLDFMRMHKIKYNPIHDTEQRKKNRMNNTLFTASLVGAGVLGAGLIAAAAFSGSSSGSSSGPSMRGSK